MIGDLLRLFLLTKRRSMIPGGNYSLHENERGREESQYFGEEQIECERRELIEGMKKWIGEE